MQYFRSRGVFPGQFVHLLASVQDEQIVVAMKHFPVSFVLVCEEMISWHVAEQYNDDSSDKTTASVGRPANSFAGAGCGTARTSDCRGPVAPRSTPSRLL